MTSRQRIETGLLLGGILLLLVSGCGGSGDPNPSEGIIPAAPMGAAAAPPAAPMAARPPAPMPMAEGPVAAPMEQEAKTTDGETEAAPPPKFSPAGVAFTSGGDVLVGIGGKPNEVELYDVNANRITRQIPKQPDPITTVAYDPRSLWGATGSASGVLQLWSLARPKVGLDDFAAEATSGTALEPLLGHGGAVTCLAIDGPGGKVASGGADGMLRLWRLARPRLVSSLDNLAPATSAVLSPDQKRLYVGDESGVVGIWDVEKLTIAGKVEGGRDPITSLALSRDGKWLIGGDQAGILHVWDPASRKRVTAIPAHRDAIVGLAQSAEGHELYTTGVDRRVRAWTFPLAVLSKTSQVHLQGGIAFGGTRFVTVVRSERSSVFDTLSGKDVHTLPGLAGRPNLTAASLRGDVIAASSWEGTALVANVAQGRVMAEVHRNGRAYKQLCVSPEGDAALLIPSDGAPLLLKLPSQGPSKSAVPASRAVAVLPGQNSFVAAGEDGQIAEWQASTGRMLARLGSLPETVRFLAASPTGNQVVAGGGSSALVWSRQGDKWTETPTNVVGGKIDCLSWTADGRSIVVGLEDGRLQILSTESKVEDVAFLAEAASSQRGRVAAIGRNQLLITDGGQAREPISSRSDKFVAVCVSPRDGLVAAAEASGAVRLIDQPGQPETILDALQGKGITALRFAPDGSRLTAGTMTGEIAVWDVPSSTTSPIAIAESVFLGKTSPDGRLVGVALENGDVRVIEAESGKKVWEWKNPCGQPVALAWSRGSSMLAVAGVGGAAEIWNVQSGASVDKQAETVGPRLAMAIVGREPAVEIVSVLKTGGLEIWEPGLKAPKRVPLEVQDLKSATLSRDASRGLLSTAKGETLLLSRSGNAVKLADVFKGEGPSAISPDGTMIAWVEEGKQVQVVPLRDQAAKKMFDAGASVKGLAFCGENRLSVLVEDGKAKVWSLPTVAAAGTGAVLESISSNRPIEEILDLDAAQGTALFKTADGTELQRIRTRLLIAGDGKPVADVALLDRPGRVIAARKGDAIRAVDIETWSDGAAGPAGTFDAVAATPAGDLILASATDGVQHWRAGAGANAKLEPVMLPEKFTRVALVEQGRDTVALTDSATIRISPQGLVERLGAGNALAVVNGRPLVHTGERLTVEEAADRNGTIAAGKTKWAAICPGRPGTVLAFGQAGEVSEVRIGEQTLIPSGTLGAGPTMVVPDPDRGVVWGAGPTGEVWQWNVEKKQKNKVHAFPEEVITLGIDQEQKCLVAGTAGGVYLVPFSGEMFVKIPTSAPAGGAGAGGVTSLALLPEQHSALTVQRGGQVYSLPLPQILNPAIPAQDLSTAVLLNGSTWAWSGKGPQVHVASTDPQTAKVVYEGARGTTVGLFTTAEDRLFALGSSGEMTEWDMRHPAEEPRLWTIDRRFKKFLVQPAARRLVLVSAAGGGLIVDLASRSVLDQLPEGDSQVDPVAFPDAGRIAVIAGDSLGVLPINSLRTIEAEGRDIAGMLTVSGSPDLFLATGGNTLGVTRCDAMTGELAATLQLSTPAQRIIPLGDDPSRAIVIASPDNGRSTVVLADLLGGKILWQRAVEGEVACAWAGLQQTLVGTKSGLLHVLNSTTGDLSQAFQTEPARSVAALQDGSTILVVTETGRLVVTESSVIRSIKGAERAVTAVALSPNGEYSATGDEDGNVILWKLADGSEVARCEGLKGPVSSLIFSDDARQLAAAGLDKNAGLWDLSEVKTGDKIQAVKLFEHPSPVRTIALTGKSDKVVTSADDNVIRVWDVASGFESEQYLGHETPPLALCLSSGAEEIILSYDAGGSLRKWSRSKVDVTKVAPSPKPAEANPDAPPPPPPPVKVEASETVAIAVKPAERLEVGRGSQGAAGGPAEEDTRPISLFGGLAAARRPRPEATMRNAIGSQLQETVGALRTETNDGRKEVLRQKAATLLDRLNAIKPSSGESLPEEEEDSTQAQAQGEGPGASLPTELVVGKEHIAAPLTAQQLVAIKTSYNFTPNRFLPVKMCITSDGKTILAMQPAFPGLEGPPPPVIPEDADDATRELILRRAAAAASRLSQGVVEAWDVATRLRLRRWTQVASMDARFVGLTPDESTLYTLPDLFAFDMATGEHRQVATGVHFANVRTGGLSLACIAPRGQLGTTSEVLQLLNGNTLVPMEPVLKGFEAYVTAMAFSPDGSRLIASIRERQRHRLVELDPQTFREVAVLETVPYTTPWSMEEPRLGITRILFLDEGQKFVTYGRSDEDKYQFLVWEGRKRISTHESEDPLISEDFVRAAVSIGGTTKVAFREGPKIHVVDHKKLVEEFEINLVDVHFGAPSIAVSGDGIWFASGDDGGNVAVWHLPTGVGPIMFRPHLGPIVGLDFSSSGQYLATVGEENILRMWKLSLPDAKGMERFYESNKQRLQKLRKPRPKATADR